MRKKQELEMAPRYVACITNGVDRCVGSWGGKNGEEIFGEGGKSKVL